MIKINYKLKLMKKDNYIKLYSKCMRLINQYKLKQKQF